MCHLIWLLSRKYGTVWYHPASSKLWYLTALSFVNFQEKLTGTSFALCACEASCVRLAACLALSALFASTLPHRSTKGSHNSQPDCQFNGKQQHHFGRVHLVQTTNKVSCTVSTRSFLAWACRADRAGLIQVANTPLDSGLTCSMKTTTDSSVWR
jgi:hypothetical protein